MGRTYTTETDLLRHVLQVKAFDLQTPVVNLSDELTHSLIPPKEGLYLPGSIEPVFEKGKQYLIDHKVKNNKIQTPAPQPEVSIHGDLVLDPSKFTSDGKPIENDATPKYISQVLPVDFNQIVVDVRGGPRIPYGNFYNLHRQFHMRRTLYERMRNHLAPNPAFSPTGSEAAVACVLEYLNSLSPFTHVNNRHRDLHELIDPNCVEPLINREAYQRAFSPLVEAVTEFVGEDTWNLYFYRVVGTTLIIEKGQDYRIVDWTRQRLRKSEGYDPTYGGIVGEEAERYVNLAFNK